MTPARGSRWWVLAVVISALMLGCAFSLDAAVQDWIRQHQTAGMRAFMRNVSAWGDWPSHVVAGALAAAFAHFRRNRRWVRICVAMIVACALVGVATRVVKVAAGRARPSVEIDAGFNGPRLSSKYHAFPSGHTSSSTAFFGVLLFANVRIAALLAALPLLIAFSRLYVGAHHLSDVVAGLLVGMAVAALVARWPKFEIADRQARIED